MRITSWVSALSPIALSNSFKILCRTNFHLIISRYRNQQQSLIPQPLTQRKQYRSVVVVLGASTQTDTMTQQSSNTPLFVDIGANLMDPMFQGIYRDKKRHEADLNLILQRAWNHGLDRIIITGGTLDECKKCLELSYTDSRLFCTVGVHPTRCSQEFGTTESSWSTYLDSMRTFIQEKKGDGKIVAMGEIGLDYCRLEFCDKETQTKGFIAQLQVCVVFVSYTDFLFIGTSRSLILLLHLDRLQKNLTYLFSFIIDKLALIY